jgi:hypothetical protein
MSEPYTFTIAPCFFKCLEEQENQLELMEALNFLNKWSNLIKLVLDSDDPLNLDKISSGFLYTQYQNIIENINDSTLQWFFRRWIKELLQPNQFNLRRFICIQTQNLPNIKIELEGIMGCFKNDCFKKCMAISSCTRDKMLLVDKSRSAKNTNLGQLFDREKAENYFLSVTKKFAIAFSFPGDDQREYIEKIADSLTKIVPKKQVLYDRYHEAEFACIDLDVELPNLYRTQSELIVIFLCKDYLEKRWCRLEMRAIRQLIETPEKKRIMLMSFDSKSEQTDYSRIGIYPGDGRIFIDNRSPEEIVELIYQRYESNKNKYDHSCGSQ